MSDYSTRDAKPAEIIAALPKLVGTSVRPGESDWQLLREHWTTHGQLETRLSYRDGSGVHVRVRVGLALLRRMAKDGLIVSHEYANQGRDSRFTSVEMAALIQAERDLSDGERAERTAAAIAARFDENVHQYGDATWRHPADTSYGWLPTDGLTEAVAAGLVVPAQGHHVKGYVPADRYDAWREAYDADQAREQRHRDMIAARKARFLELCPPTGRDHRVVELDLGQVEALIGALSHLAAADLS